MNQSAGAGRILESLRERAKELSCLYEVETVLAGNGSLEKKLEKVAGVIPSGWFDPRKCSAEIQFQGRLFSSGPGEIRGPSLLEKINIGGETVGEITVFCPPGFSLPGTEEAFLPEEVELLSSIASRIKEVILHSRPSGGFESSSSSDSWEDVLELVRITDKTLYLSLVRRLLNYTVFTGVPGSGELLREWTGKLDASGAACLPTDWEIVPKVLKLAGENCRRDTVAGLVRRWIAENRIDELSGILDRRNASLSEVIRAMEIRRDLLEGSTDVSGPEMSFLKAALARKFAGNDSEFLDAITATAAPSDYLSIARGLCYSRGGTGTIGGKGAGILLAGAFLRNLTLPGRWRAETPLSRFAASDVLQSFLERNGLARMVQGGHFREMQHQPRGLNELFQGCTLPPGVVEGLQAVCAELGDIPLVVRCSSLLSGTSGVSFAGMYPGVFVPRCDDPREKLKLIKGAVKRVYSSVFNPGVMAYREMVHLADRREEPALVVQPVAGSRAGEFYLPWLSGTAWSRNTLKSVPGVLEEDGMMKLVPGLGTGLSGRHLHRGSILFPGKPGRTAVRGTENAVRWSSREMDVLLKDGTGPVSIATGEFLRKAGRQFPLADMIFSTLRKGSPVPVTEHTDFQEEFAFTSFQGLADPSSSFCLSIHEILRGLEKRTGYPVEIEFTVNHDTIYLLQCRKQFTGTVISREVEQGAEQSEEVLFSSPGFTGGKSRGNITHLIRIHGGRYGKLNTEDRREVRNILSRINRVLPHGSSIVSVPGPWEFGNWQEVCSAVAVVEVFQGEGFPCHGRMLTHFHRTMAEAGILHGFFFPKSRGSVSVVEAYGGDRQSLNEVIPGAAVPGDALEVTRISRLYPGRTAVFFTDTEGRVKAFLEPMGKVSGITRVHSPVPGTGEHWKWRKQIAEEIATGILPDRYGVRGIYLFGSVKNAVSGPESDIDLLVHITGCRGEKSLLEGYFHGWDRSLCGMVKKLYGVSMESVLDVHYITDDDIRQGSSWALRIGAVNDPARPLPMGTG